MPLISLLPIFHRLNREHFGGSLAEGHTSKLQIRWSDGKMKRTAGLYRSSYRFAREQESEIILSKPILTNLPQSALESTLCHEMIHAWIDLILEVYEKGHGSLFRSRMASINAAQNSFQVTIRHSFPVPDISAKWLAVCSLCHRKFHYKRMVKNASCRKCCDLFFQGQWNRDCLLKYQLQDS